MDFKALQKNWRVAAVITLGELGTRLAHEEADAAFNEMENPNWNMSNSQAIAEHNIEMLKGAIATLKELIADDLKEAENG